MYCPNCGERISDKAEICPKCGVRPFRVIRHCYHCGAAVNERQEMCVSCGAAVKKNPSTSGAVPQEPWLMVLLSFILPGLGQILLGQVAKGVIIIFVNLFFLFVFTLFWFITVPLSIVDAYLIAKKKQDGKQVGEWEFF
ncbi:hypothetical protein JNUCC1_01362 [Lentibacillus sp. JNUCC-1]|uniref:zinc ribbon domain-containing protein n=1 Tax=Lentibacillus sp. JNUCC-1 TaxID=2654513 RepID=UPI0012E6FEE4|nr:zinc ribbon domain-containing protein [Lentibacillus sp. JNUCC-1]MUV37556.1 hypothetical protein [Lentibacillus sp. JNUCC-1]